MEAIWHFDASILQFLNRGLQNPLFDWLMPKFDRGFYWWAPMALGIIGVLIFGGKRGAWAALGAVTVIILTDQIAGSILKPLTTRIRPCNILPGLHVWWEAKWIYLPDPVVEFYKASWSFPSSHAANTAGQAVWWGWIYPKARWWAIGFSALVGYSRIYDGVHWPTDIMGGWALGAITAVGLILTIRWWKVRKTS